MLNMKKRSRDADDDFDVLMPNPKKPKVDKTKWIRGKPVLDRTKEYRKAMQNEYERKKRTGNNYYIIEHELEDMNVKRKRTVRPSIPRKRHKAKQSYHSLVDEKKHKGELTKDSLVKRVRNAERIPTRRTERISSSQGAIAYGAGVESDYEFVPYESKIAYRYFDNANELVDRLKLLLSSKAAGNSNHSFEIRSIIEELREADIIH